MFILCHIFFDFPFGRYDMLNGIKKIAFVFEPITVFLGAGEYITSMCMCIDVQTSTQSESS